MTRAAGFVVAVLSVSICVHLWFLSPAFAEDPKLDFSTADIRGTQVKVPTSGPSVMLFVMADQPQSRDAVKLARAQVAGQKDVQAVAILSGPQSADSAKALAATGDWPYSVIADTDYAASGKFGVHVWPTTVVIDSTGHQAAHLASLSKSYGKDLAAYIDLAAGKIDRATLEKRLADTDVITDTPEQMATRHVQVAQRLLDKGLVDQARAELTEAMKHQPKDLPLQLALVRVLLQVDRPQDALVIIDQIDPASLPPWQIPLLRGRATFALGRPDEAQPLLIKATQLNPEPAEAWYTLGLLYQHQKDAPKSAEAFRKAFESTDAGRKLAPASTPTTSP